MPLEKSNDFSMINTPNIVWSESIKNLGIQYWHRRIIDDLLICSAANLLGIHLLRFQDNMAMDPLWLHADWGIYSSQMDGADG